MAKKKREVQRAQSNSEPSNTKKAKIEPKFNPRNLNQTIVSIPLLEDIKNDPEAPHDVIIDTNLEYVEGRSKAREKLERYLQEAIKNAGDPNRSAINEIKTEQNQQYVFARLEADVIRELVKIDLEGSLDKKSRVIYKIWPDFPIYPLITESVKTVKADAAKISFTAMGDGVVWAVIDSGVDNTHPHFIIQHKDTEIADRTFDTGYDRDFTVLQKSQEKPFQDDLGHGTHVAGIIAGEQFCKVNAAVKFYNEKGEEDFSTIHLDKIAGIASKAKLVSLKVVNEEGEGKASNIIAAITHIQEINGYGRHLKIHGVNISIGHRFEPEWFACGQSPLCVEVNRLVKSGVIVVVAAGNSGYGFVKTDSNREIPAGISLSINDPGNAELAITVGATHRNMPHMYGVSYFSSKGPTGDGRLKPDLVAPGERIISCARGTKKFSFQSISSAEQFDYCEDSGTSMAAPHVSGAIAAFLSVRREFIGRPEDVKDIFTSTATDLKRDKYFQGHGLVDLMRAIQSV